MRWMWLSMFVIVVGYGIDAQVQQTSSTRPFYEMGDNLAQIVSKVDDFIFTSCMPYDTIMPGVKYENESSDKIVAYDDHGDSAIWSGHYLASQAFRYWAATVSKNQQERSSARKAIVKVLSGIQRLIEVARQHDVILARIAVPANSQDAAVLLNKKYVYTSYINGQPWLLYDKVSPDQILGVIFGLATAYTFVPDQDVKNKARELIYYMVKYLVDNKWYLKTPEFKSWLIWDLAKLRSKDKKPISEEFHTVPHHKLSILQVGRHVSPEFQQHYLEAVNKYAKWIWLALWISSKDPYNKRYFRFNLVHISMYNLIRFETDWRLWLRYQQAFEVIRRVVRAHNNIHFDLIEYALRPVRYKSFAFDTRKTRIKSMMDEFIKRSRRNQAVDLTADPSIPKKWHKIDGEWKLVATIPVPISKRPYESFIWQKSPFTLAEGGDNKSESAHIDLVLPYWMGRVYGYFYRTD